MTATGPDPAKSVWDAHRAAEKITRFTTGRSYDDYLADDMLRVAEERQFEIIGEACSALRKTHPEIAAKIPDINKIIAFRNVLIHGYATVDDRIVWDVVERNLAVLLATLKTLMPVAKSP